MNIDDLLSHIPRKQLVIQKLITLIIEPATEICVNLEIFVFYIDKRN